MVKIILSAFTAFLLLVSTSSVLAKSDKGRSEEDHGNGKSVILEAHGNKLKVTEVDEKGEEEPEDETEETESFEVELEETEEATGTATIKASNNSAVVIKNKLETQTKFPLRVNLETNELIVNTPKGAKVVTILPDKAVQNMLAAKVLDQIGGKAGLLWLAENPTATSSATPSATPVATASGSPTSSPSATPLSDEESAITLELEEGVLVYKIKGSKKEKFIGLFSIDLDRTVVVSATSGDLIEIRQNLLTKLLDLLSI